MISDFIGVFDKAFDPAFCDELIQHFEYVRTHTAYLQPRGCDPLDIDDKSLIFNDFSTDGNVEITSAHRRYTSHFHKGAMACLDEYKKEYSILDRPERSGMFDLKIQKTVPGQAFHTWHCEAFSRFTSTRYLVYQLYLNTVDDGGETEFIYQHRRIKPKQGTMIIWPAAFTHTHRGNQPLSGPKYIMTTWEEFF